MEPQNHGHADGLSPLWRVPYPPNPFFTGRARALGEIRDALQESGFAAVAGDPELADTRGCGKTQTAVAYAYRYREQYAAVIWVRAETACTLLEDCLDLLPHLGLKLSRDQVWGAAIASVRGWLQSHANWLLILDNADPSEGVHDWVFEGSRGHVLALSPRQDSRTRPGTRAVTLGPLPHEEAIRFLYKRTNRPETDPAEREAVANLVTALGGIPLALELAGAFMASTQMPFQDYLGQLNGSPGESAETDAERSTRGSGTIRAARLGLEHARRHGSAADGLSATAWVGREVLPAEALHDAHAGLELEDAGLDPITGVGVIRPLRDPDGYALHPVVQEQILAQLGEERVQDWTRRTLQEASRLCGADDAPGVSSPHRVLRWVDAAVRLARVGALVSPEEGRLLLEVAGRLEALTGPETADPVVLAAWSILEANRGLSRTDAAALAHDLAQRFLRARRYAQAEQFFARSLAVRERALGPAHPDLARYLHDLGRLYDQQRLLPQADEYFLRSLALRKRQLGADHPEVAEYLVVLGERCLGLSRNAEAEVFFRRALAAREEAHGNQPARLASYVHDTACRFADMGRLAEAEPLFLRAITLTKQARGATKLGTYLHSLGRLYYATDRFRQAEACYQDALGDPPYRADAERVVTLNDLGCLYLQRGRYAKAQPLLEEAVLLARKTLSPDDSNLAIALNNLAALYYTRRRYALAEPLLRQALAIRRRHLSSNHPELLPTMENYLMLLRALRRATEAERVEARVSEIRARVTQIESLA